MSRTSNRVYPERKCQHCCKIFTPHDFRQKHCCKQHRIDASNDKRRKENETRFVNEKHLRRNDRILERVYKRMQQLNIPTVFRRELLLLGMDKDKICVEVSQDEKSRLIRRTYQYGLRAVDKDANEFKIIKLS